MKLKKMTWKRVIALFCATVLLGTSIPMENLKAAENVSLSLSTEKVVLELGNDVATDDKAQVTAIVTPDDDVTIESQNMQWSSGNENVAKVTQNGQIEAVGVGTTNITATCFYTESSVEGTSEPKYVSGTVQVVVYETPVLQINVENKDNLIFPDALNVSVENVPNGANCNITIVDKDGNEVDTKVGSRGSFKLAAGEYEIVATTSDTTVNGGFYRSATESVTTIVAYGETGFAVTANTEKAYCGDIVSYNVSSRREGKVTVSVDGNKEILELKGQDEKTGKYEYSCAAAGEKSITFTFEDAEDKTNYYEEPVTMSLDVQKIPVTIQWANDLSKTYDGTSSFVTSIHPEAIVANEAQGRMAPTLVNKAPYQFTTESITAGKTTATLNDDNAITIAENPDYYEVVDTTPTVQVQINAVVLDGDSVIDNGFTVASKGFDGTSKAKVTGDLLLNIDSLVKADVENGKEFVLTYEADYYKNKQKNSGSVNDDTKDLKVKVINFVVNEKNGEDYEVCTNYNFGNYEKEVEGNYSIHSNGDFFTFIGLDLPEKITNDFGNEITEKLGPNNIDTYYKVTSYKKFEGYTFAVNSKNEFTTDLIFNQTLSFDKEDKDYYVYAKNADGEISQSVRVQYDGTSPTGQLVAVLSGDKEEKTISVETLVKDFSLIKKQNEIVTINFKTTDEDVETVEWYGSDVALVKETEDSSTIEALWSSIDISKIQTAKLEGGICILDTIESEGGLKRFYYAKVKDNGGNVAYFQSSGVLEDILPPSVQITLDKDIYGGTTGKVDVNVDLEIKEEGITSGVSVVSVSLSRWNKGEYQTVDGQISWSETEALKLKAMQALKEADNPTEAEIKAASGTIALKGVLSDLEDGKYKVDVKAYDKAGNESKVAEQEFIVDTQEPVIRVETEFTKVEKADFADGNQYTGGTVIITVSDLTLKNELENATPIATLKNGESVIPINWNDTYEEDGTLQKTAKLVLDKNGIPEKDETVNYLDNGKYNLTFSVSDAFTTGKRAFEITGSENKVEALNFVYDDTAPVYEINFNEPTTKVEDIVNGKTKVYYNETITADITILEATTYDDKKIKVDVVKFDGENEEIVASWPSVSDESQENTKKPIRIEHETGANEFEVVIEALENHSTDAEGYYVAVTGYDQTGNILAPETESESESESEIYRELDTIVPDLTSVSYDTEDKFNHVKGKDYVNADTKVTFALTEDNPYVSAYKHVRVNSDSDVVVEEKNLEWVEKDIAKDLYSIETTVSIPEEEKATDLGDERTLTLEIKDKAGNIAKMTHEEGKLKNTSFDAETGTYKSVFTIDQKAPIITYEYIDDNPNNVNVNGIDYFKEKAQVKVTVEEHNFDESCTVKPYVTAKNEANIAYTESDWVSTGDVHVKTFTFENDNEYEIKIDATDCAFNDFVLGDVDEKITVKKDESNPGTTALKLAVDKTLTAIGDTKKPVVVVNPVQNPGTTTDGQALYNTDVVYEVAVYDPKVNNYASGIDEIEITLTAEDGTTAKAIIAKDGTVTTETGMNVVLTEGVAGSLAQGEENKYVYHVTIAKDKFNSNGIKMAVKATDISTNVTSKTDVQEVAIDTTAPTVVIEYNNDDVRNGKYFHKGRTAIIKVTERNFSDDCLNFYVNNKRIDLTFTLKNAGTGNRDDAVWVAKHKINKDGDYVIKCDVKDRVENEGTISYEGKATKKFTVDKTMPKIALSFNNNNAQNNSYYSSARTATITITEHNFRGSDIEITGTANNAGTAVAFPGISKWKSKGDVHTATITFTEDALYSLDIAYKDLALNAAKSPENNTFTIDNTDPEITFSDVKNGGAYPDEVIPKILFNDNNYLSHTITLTRTNRENTNEDVTSKFVRSSGVKVDGTGKANGSNTIPDVAHEQENDGIYTITVTVRDKAGRTKTETISYSVNRFGSVYVYSDDLLALLNGYTKLEDISNKDLSITAYNADSLIAEETKLEITCDGEALTSQKSKADVKKAKLDSDGWYAYRFQLDTADFEKEGSYVVMISDKDTAGNVQTNSDNPIEFSIDGTDPKLDSVIGLEEERYNTEEQTVKYTVSDAMGIAKIEIYIDGKVVETIEEFDNAATYEGQFVIPESSDRQSVKIVVTDKAGRVLDTSSEAFANDDERGYVFNSSVLVSTSLFDLWYDNKPVFWGSIAGVAALLGLFFFIILGKKKKEEDEEDEAV